MKFAIVDPSRKQAEVLKALLKSEGHQGEIFTEGRDCLDAMDTGAFEFFVFDWGLLDISGSQLLDEIRRRHGWQVPVIVCSALASEENVSDILRAGADDFVAKPIRYMEFTARVEALLRHCHATATPRLRVGNIEIDLNKQKILVGGADAGLTQREFDLATLFLTNIAFFRAMNCSRTCGRAKSPSTPAPWTPMRAGCAGNWGWMAPAGWCCRRSMARAIGWIRYNATERSPTLANIFPENPACPGSLVIMRALSRS
jgi:DNA-binding response OmpR family regulator